MSVNAITYVYGDREVKIWELCDSVSEEQAEKDETARNRIIWERLNPAADWFFCHINGKRIEAGTALEHGDRVLNCHRDEVDPGWWSRAMREMKEREEIKFTPPTHWLEDEEEVDPEIPQSGWLSSSRLCQHEEKAQTVWDKDVSREVIEESETVKTVPWEKICDPNWLF
jgi:hypothetical protein